MVTPTAPHVYLEDIAKYDGQDILLKGWLYNKRSSGKIRFVMLRDGTGLIQCVGSINDIGEEGFAAVDSMGQESSLMVVGTVKAEPRAPGGFEMILKQVIPVHVAMGEFPISPKEHGTAFLMDNRHLWLRSKRQVAIMRIRHAIAKAIRDFFDGRGFTLFDPPIFTNAACEGTSTLFETDYFGETAYLSQSGQLYGECGAMALGKIYTFGPTFRAEKSKTRRHLTEFWMIQPEVAYMDMWGAAELAEDMCCFIVQRVLETRMEELKVIERDPTILEKIQKPFPRISYDDAIKVLKNAGHDIEWGGDIGGDEETTISNLNDRPTILHHFPADLKAFYMKRDAGNPKLALGFDVLAPEGKGEVIGGGQREDDYDVLVERIKEHGLNVADFEWFLDLRKYGSVPHAGYGLGLERTVAWLCGLPHVRNDSVPENDFQIETVTSVTLDPVRVREGLKIVNWLIDLLPLCGRPVRIS